MRSVWGVAIRFLAILALSPFASCAVDTELPWTSERELLGNLTSLDHDPQILLRHCVARSWWSAAREVVTSSRKNDDSESLSNRLSEEVRELVKNTKQRADTFAAFAEATYHQQRSGLDEVHCAVQWAQNSTTVFVAVKYAVRWSAPGAIQIADLEVNISSSSFSLNGYGHHSGIRKRYMVNLPLHGEILPGNSTWSSASVGRLTATIQKVAAGLWPKLTRSDDHRHQVTTWLDMEERWAPTSKATDPKKIKSSKKKAKASDKEHAEKKPVEKKSKKSQDVFSLSSVLKRMKQTARAQVNQARKHVVGSVCFLLVACCGFFLVLRCVRRCS